MPSYEFECENCNTRFTRILKMEAHLTHPCPGCKQDAGRSWDADIAFAFKSSPSASGKANTGVHVEDYPTADKAVGRDADSRWAELNERDKVKNEARKKGGTHALIRHNDPAYIDYEPMTLAGQQTRRTLAKSISERARAQREERIGARRR